MSEDELFGSASSGSESGGGGVVAALAAAASAGGVDQTEGRRGLNARVGAALAAPVAVEVGPDKLRGV